jgi:hypothetical protein
LLKSPINSTCVEYLNRSRTANINLFKLYTPGAVVPVKSKRRRILLLKVGYGARIEAILKRIVKAVYSGEKIDTQTY